MAVSLHERCLDATVAIFAALPLAKGVATRVYKMQMPVPMQTDGYPCSFVTIEDCTPKLRPFDTENDEKILPVRCHLMDRADWKEASRLSQWLLWQEQLTSSVLMQIFGSVLPQNWDIQLRCMPALDAQKALGKGYENAVSSFYLDCACITPRVRPS